jgi:hypothetical protein
VTPGRVFRFGTRSSAPGSPETPRTLGLEDAVSLREPVERGGW